MMYITLHFMLVAITEKTKIITSGFPLLGPDAKIIVVNKESSLILMGFELCSQCMGMAS